jgi:hypothetical protein
MAVREFGLMINGVTIISREYRDEEKRDDSFRVVRDGLISAIQTIAQRALQEQVESFKMSGTTIIITCKPVILKGREEMLCAFAICDPKPPEKLVKEALNEILSEFTRTQIIRSYGSSQMYAHFEKQIDEILGDLLLRPEDRVALLFE